MKIDEMLNKIEWENYSFSMTKKRIENTVKEIGIKKADFKKGVKYLVVVRYMNNHGYSWGFSSFLNIVFVGGEAEGGGWCINEHTIGVKFQKVPEIFSKVEIKTINEMVDSWERQREMGDDAWYKLKNQRFFELYHNTQAIILFEDNDQEHVGHDLFGIYDVENKSVIRIPVNIFWEHYFSKSEYPSRKEVRDFFKKLKIPKRITERIFWD